MSWLSQFAHNPGQFITHEPLKALALLAAPAAAIAAPFAIPALGSALGIGAGAGAAGAGVGLAEGAGLLGAEAGGLLGAEAGLGGALTATGAAGGGAESILSSLGIDGGAFGSDALGAFAADTSGGLGADTGIASLAGGTPATDAIAAQGFAPLAGPEAAAAQPGFFDNLVTGATNSITRNPIGVGLGVGGLAYNIAAGQKVSPEMKAMSENAKALNAQGQQLMSYLQSGTLPPGLQTAIDNAKAASRARIIANHARNGQATDPSMNSALAQELNQLDLNATALIAQKGQELLTTGMNATNMSTQLYSMLEGMNRQQSQQMGQAIANFAAALSGPRPIQINTGGIQRAA